MTDSNVLCKETFIWNNVPCDKRGKLLPIGGAAYTCNYTTDGIHAEHLNHCSDILIPLLSKCFTGLLVHGTLPESMIDVVLVPIVKNKRASICSKANYRPIALASIVSKIFEKLLNMIVFHMR